MQYEIQTRTYCDGWINCSHDNAQPLFFKTFSEAVIEVNDMLKHLDINKLDIRIKQL